jgi:aldose 1-epimerase
MDREIELKHGIQRACVAPFGASLRAYWLEQPRRDVLWGYSGRGGKRGGQGDVLIPFPGRIAGGRYAFEGYAHELPRNDKDGPNAIHGFLRGVEWEVAEESSDRVRFQRGIRPDEFPGYPFALHVELDYALGPGGLRCGFRIRNEGRARAPVGAGFHPYFTVGTEHVDEAWLGFTAKEVLEFGPGLLPTGRVLAVPGTPFDFSRPRAVGSTRFNHCFGGIERDAAGWARVRLSTPDGSQGVEFWFDSAFPYLVLYTGDAIPPPGARQALAIEPMTCATDAFNRPEWGLKALQPGEAFGGAWGFSTSR